MQSWELLATIDFREWVDYNATLNKLVNVFFFDHVDVDVPVLTTRDNHSLTCTHVSACEVCKNKVHASIRVLCSVVVP